MSMTLSLEKIKEWEKEQNFDKEENDLALLESSYSDGTFPILSGDVKQAYASHLCQTWEIASDSFRQSLLQFLRIILRDKENSDLDCFLPLFNVLVQLVALTNDKETDVSAPTKLMLEADKCLVNLLFNSSKARELFQNTPFSQLLSRINTIENVYGGVETLYQFEYLNAWSNNEIEELLHYDMKIAFIATALIRKLQKECIEDTDKTMIFVNIVKYSVDKIISQDINKEALFTTMAWKYTNESLKTLLNLYHNATIFDLDTAQKCAAICREIVQNTILDMETKQNAVNLLAVLPSTLPNLCPKIDSKTSSKKSSTALEDYDLGFVDALLKTFEEQIDSYEKEKSFIIEFLGTFLTVLNHLCTEHKACRRFCRFKIIPPLKAQQVERPPEVGGDFRNKIVRLMMGSSRCKELAAEFLFMLCKRSVGRLIKYCGFGHSAGLLANYGFLGQVTTARRIHPSDSEDSETEEYKQVEEKINPVTGSIPQPEQLDEWRRQIDSMSEEQKEYEMMKLVDCLDKLMDQGMIAPGTIGEDGRPREVKHIAELIKDVKEEKGSDSD